MGNTFNVETTGSNVKQLILKKLDGRYGDLHEEIIDATTIGSLKNWPSENNEGTKNNFTDGILVTFLLMFIFFLSLFESLFTFYFSITAYVFSV